MKKQALPFIIILLIAVATAFILRNVLNETLVRPLLYIFWIGRLLLVSLPQVILWGLFLLLALLITARLLWTPRSHRRRRQSPPPPEQAGPVATWLKLIRQADRETYYRWQLAQRLRHLILDALAHDLRLTRRQVRRRLTDNQLDLPPDIQAYLQASRISFGHFIPRRRHVWPIKNERPSSALDLEPERIAQFIEERFQL